MQKKTKLSTTAVLSSIEILKKLKIIKIIKTDVTKNVQVDLDSKNYTSYKRIFNLYQIEKYTDFFIEKFNPQTIVLFGSYAKGEDIEESDIDILILTNHKINLNLDFMEKDLKRKINLHVLPSLDKSESEFKNAISNGIVLYGYLKLV